MRLFQQKEVLACVLGKNNQPIEDKSKKKSFYSNSEDTFPKKQPFEWFLWLF
jgi:hypothetical protein